MARRFGSSEAVFGFGLALLVAVFYVYPLMFLFNTFMAL
jgi:hypothetical protein